MFWESQRTGALGKAAMDPKPPRPPLPAPAPPRQPARPCAPRLAVQQAARPAGEGPLRTGRGREGVGLSMQALQADLRSSESITLPTHHYLLVSGSG
jgi:hypothetical protein